MGTPGAVMLFAIPPLVVYAIARWYGETSKQTDVAAPALRTTAVGNAFERFEKPSRNRNGQFAKRA